MTSQKDLFTNQIHNLSLCSVCGIDEAGRGPLAGPVTAAAVVLNEDFPIAILRDSKKLGEKKRLEIEILIKEQALSWAVAVIDHSIIDEINILQATLLAMEEAFFSMHKKNAELSLDTIIVDGNKIPQKLSAFQNKKIDCLAIPKADANYPSVMAASILAKNERDRIMCSYAKLYPDYLYEQHKGYPTKQHREICKTKGPSPIQRKTFRF